MPSAEATRFELAVYVAPEHVATFKKLVDASDDNCLLLDIEKAIGRRLEGLERLSGGFIDGEHYDYGEGVAEVYMEDES